MRDLHRGHAIDGRLLDCGVRYPGIRGLRSVPGEFPGHEELARAQERRAREPMAHEATHLRPVAQFVPAVPADPHEDRKSTRLNSSHLVISYAVFCLKKKKTYSTSHMAHTHRQ